MISISLLLLLWAALLPQGDTPNARGAWPFATASSPKTRAPAPGPATYDSGAKAVANWRDEAVGSLEPKPLSLAAVMLQVERPIISRCVKLNNYWCIKRARWPGEIGGDEEGHTGFATAGYGADAAVALLRRYYLGFQRRSALDIVRRWAPAACGAGGGVLSGFATTLAVRGLANTLRARYLGSRRGGAGPKRSGGRRAAAPSRALVSRIPLAPMPSFRVPDIAAGLGERKPVGLATAPPRRAPTTTARPVARAATRAPSTPVRVAPVAPASVQTSFGCGDPQRIQNYAARIADAAGVRSGDDLRLFDAQGHAMPVLQRVLLAMSSVELGLLHASSALVEAAIVRAVAAAAEPPPTPAQTAPLPERSAL